LNLNIVIGNRSNDGIWVDTEESVVFDKRFYEEIYCREWRPRNIDTDVQDWTRGKLP
jgi:hypothetical protein